VGVLESCLKERGMMVVMDVVTVDSLAGCARAVLLEKK
jgi:hypothetical protein